MISFRFILVKIKLNVLFSLRKLLLEVKITIEKTISYNRIPWLLSGR